MYSKIKKTILLLLSLTLFTSGFSAHAAELIPEEEIQLEETNRATDIVEKGDFIIESIEKGYLFLPDRHAVLYQGESGTVLINNMKKGNQVEAGDVLMTISLEHSAVEEEEIRIKLNRLKENYQQKVDEYDWNLSKENKRYQLLTDSYEKQKKEIEIKRLQLEREQYVFWKEQEIESLQNQLTSIENKTGVVDIVADKSGLITEANEMKEGDAIAKGTRVGILSTYERVLIRVKTTDFSYGSQANIQMGPREQRIDLSGKVVFSTDCLSNASEEYVLICPNEKELIEKTEIESLDGFGDYDYVSISVAGKKVELSSVLMVNKTACIQEYLKTYVRIQDEDGFLHKRYVKAGFSNKEKTWILLGLSEGEKVVLGKD